MVSIVITGNPGSGKSFLGNLLLQKERFVHRFSPRAVTTVEEWEEIDLFPNQRSFVWNLQGMLEPNARNIQRNRLALEKAIRSQPEQLFLYVVRPRSGCRLSWEDVAYFQQLWLSYNLCYESTVVLFNAGSDQKSWQAEILSLFCHLVSLDPSKLKHVFVDLLNTKDPGPKDVNRSQILQQIRLCEPCYHNKTGEIQLEAEVMHLYRNQIEQQMVVFTKLKQDIQQLQQDRALLIRNAEENEAQYKTTLQQFDSKDQEILVFHQTQLNEFNRISALLKEQSEAITKYIQECEDLNTRYRQMVRKNRNVFRQIGNVGKMIYKKPLLALPIVVTTVLVPMAAPALALSLGVSTTVATASLTVATGVGSALIQKQDVGKAALTGVVGGLVPIPCVSAAACALVNKQNVGAAILGSIAASTVSFSVGSLPGSQILASTAGSCTTALIADPKNASNAIAQGLVNGSIGAAAASMASMASVKLSDRNEKTKEVKENKEIKESKMDVPPSVGETRQKLSPPALTDFQASNPSNHSNHHNPQNKSKMVLSQKGISFGLNGFNAATTGAVGATKTHSDGSSTGVGAVVSDIYPGGIATVVKQSSAPSSSSSSTSSNSIMVQDRVFPVTTHETVGVCFASRTHQFQQMDAFTGSMVQVVEKQEHFNVEGCLGDPAKVLVGGAAVLIVVPLVPLVPLLPPLLSH